VARRRPAVFVGSSTEGLRIAKAIQVLLDPTCEVTVWSQGVFGLSQGTLESLVLSLDKFDFAVLILTPDDLVTSKNEKMQAPRDNVLFELGLFIGGLGRDRTFLVYDRTAQLKLPSDLAGVTAATFEPHSSGNLASALGAAATKVESVIERLGVRDQERIRRLTEAASGVEGVSSQVQTMVRLLARSRKVELDIISAQFGPLIDPKKLAQIRQDLLELEQSLSSSEKAGSNDAG
jgi:hypothetical protein